jgi:uncharacterized membrane protein
MPQERIRRESEGPGLSPAVMAHVFRGELSRSDTWRTRLDTTTNWALTTTAAVISFAFSSPASSHVVLLVGVWMVASFLMIEARRYRYYDLWNRRVRLIEGGYWSPLLRREPVDPDALRELANEMSRPQIQLSLFSAVAVRMNRAYGPILLVLLISWFVKLYGHPHIVRSWDEFLERGHIGPLPGLMVVVILFIMTLFVVFAIITAMVTRPPLGELKPRPRSKRLALWEVMFRPYAVPPSRHRAHRRERATAPRSGRPEVGKP